jgi:hypothetical protein
MGTTSFHIALVCSPFKILYQREPNFGDMPNITVAENSPVGKTALEYQAQPRWNFCVRNFFALSNA